MKRNVIQMIQDEEILQREDIDYLLYNIENRNDLLTLNYVQNSVVNKFGRSFLEQSKDKIEFVLQLLLDDNPVIMYNFYKETSDQYLQASGTDDIAPFNLIFLTYIYFAYKILKRYS